MSKKHLYVVVGSYDYEGYNPPAGIFTDKRKAVRFMRSSSMRGDNRHLFKYEIDQDEEQRPEEIIP